MIVATPPTPGRRRRAGAVVQVARALRNAPMPWQRHVARVSSELADDGPGWAYGTVVVTVPRQAGKTVTSRATSVARGLTIPDHQSWYTAQTREDARRRFLDLAAAVQHRRCPIRPPFTTVRLSNGSEGMHWPSGSAHRLFAPTEAALHGEALDMVTIDEAWSHSEVLGQALLGAAVPGGLTRPWFQLWIVSTAGDASSAWLRGFVDAGRAAVAAGARAGIAYFETRAEGPDPEQLLDAHPAVGHTTTRDRLARLIAAAGPDAPRAFGNLWPDDNATGPFPPGTWAAAAADVDPPTTGPAAVAIDVAPDRSATSIAVAWRRGQTTAAAVAVTGPGTGWVLEHAARLAHQLACPVTYDERSAAAALVDAWPATVRRRAMGTRDVTTAAQQVHDAVAHGTITIRPDPALDVAAAGAVTRPIGDAWAWGRRTSTADITPLVALTFACWGLWHETREPLLLV